MSVNIKNSQIQRKLFENTINPSGSSSTNASFFRHTARSLIKNSLKKKKLEKLHQKPKNSKKLKKHLSQVNQVKLKKRLFNQIKDLSYLKKKDRKNPKDNYWNKLHLREKREAELKKKSMLFDAGKYHTLANTQTAKEINRFIGKYNRNSQVRVMDQTDWRFTQVEEEGVGNLKRMIEKDLTPAPFRSQHPLAKQVQETAIAVKQPTHPKFLEKKSIKEAKIFKKICEEENIKLQLKNSIKMDEEMLEMMIQRDQINQAQMIHPSQKEYFDAVKRGDFNLVQILTCEHKSIVKCTDVTGQTGLHWACKRGYTEMAEYFVKECGISPLQTDFFHRTALDVAKRHKQTQILALNLKIKYQSYLKKQRSLHTIKFQRAMDGLKFSVKCQLISDRIKCQREQMARWKKLGSKIRVSNSLLGGNLLATEKQRRLRRMKTRYEVKDQQQVRSEQNSKMI